MIDRLWFFYSVPYTVIAAVALAQNTAVVNISADADFEWVYCTAVVKQAGLIVTNWSGTVMIEDNSPGRTLFNTPIPLDAIAGNGRQPYPLSPPRLLYKNSTLTLTFTNFVATETHVSVTLHGNKLGAVS